jgi:hypothetical protein
MDRLQHLLHPACTCCLPCHWIFLLLLLQQVLPQLFAQAGQACDSLGPHCGIFV